MIIDLFVVFLGLVLYVLLIPLAILNAFLIEIFPNFVSTANDIAAQVGYFLGYVNYAQVWFPVDTVKYCIAFLAVVWFVKRYIWDRWLAPMLNITPWIKFHPKDESAQSIGRHTTNV